MKALTIHQPYASLIASGAKRVENRRWKINYRGLLAIHAGQGTAFLSPGELEKYPTGVVLATAELFACFHINEIRGAYEAGKELPGLTAKAVAELAEHKFTEGPYCWVLRRIQPLKTPVRHMGRQGLWDFDESLIREKEQQPPGGELEAIAERPQLLELPICPHMNERGERVAGFRQMLLDLHQLAKANGCIAAAWAIDAINELTKPRKGV